MVALSMGGDIYLYIVVMPCNSNAHPPISGMNVSPVSLPMHEKGCHPVSPSRIVLNEYRHIHLLLTYVFNFSFCCLSNTIASKSTITSSVLSFFTRIYRIFVCLFGYFDIALQSIQKKKFLFMCYSSPIHVPFFLDLFFLIILHDMRNIYVKIAIQIYFGRSVSFGPCVLDLIRNTHCSNNDQAQSMCAHGERKKETL